MRSREWDKARILAYTLCQGWMENMAVSGTHHKCCHWEQSLNVSTSVPLRLFLQGISSTLGLSSAVQWCRKGYIWRGLIGWNTVRTLDYNVCISGCSPPLFCLLFTCITLQLVMKSLVCRLPLTSPCTWIVIRSSDTLAVSVCLTHGLLLYFFLSLSCTNADTYIDTHTHANLHIRSRRYT